MHTDIVPCIRQADEISYIALFQSLFKCRIVEPSVHSAENQRIDVSERLDGAHDGMRDSRYAVVDELYALDGSKKFHSVLYALVVFKRPHDILIGYAAAPCGLGREHTVLDIVLAQKMGVYVAVLLGVGSVYADSDRLARIFGEVEEAVEPLIRVIYKRISLTLIAHYIELRADIAFEAVIVIEVLGIYICQHGNMRRTGSKFKLVRRHLDNRCFARAVLKAVKHGISHVTYQARLFSGGAEHGINERGGGGLALCARHSNAVKARIAKKKIGLAGYLHALRSLPMQQRHTGCLYDRIGAVYGVEIAVAADKLNIRVVDFDLLRVRDYQLLLGQVAADKIIGRVTLAPHAEQDYSFIFKIINQLLIHIQTSSLCTRQIFSG